MGVGAIVVGIVMAMVMAMFDWDLVVEVHFFSRVCFYYYFPEHVQIFMEPTPKTQPEDPRRIESTPSRSNDPVAVAVTDNPRAEGDPLSYPVLSWHCREVYPSNQTVPTGGNG